MKCCSVCRELEVGKFCIISSQILKIRTLFLACSQLAWPACSFSFLCKLSKPKITFNYSLLDIFLLLINCETRTEKVYLPKLQAQTNISWSGFKSLELVVKNIPAARPGSKRNHFLLFASSVVFTVGEYWPGAGCWEHQHRTTAPQPSNVGTGCRSKLLCLP